MALPETTRITKGNVETWTECLLFGAAFAVFAVILFGIRLRMERAGATGRGKQPHDLDRIP